MQVGITLFKPLQIFRLYGWRFKIQVSLKQAIHTVGAYAYLFWMQDMNPIHRGSGKQYVQRKSELFRQHVRRKLAAYERHIQAGLIAQGLLQYRIELKGESTRKARAANDRRHGAPSEEA